jgi:uncharacterized LabA/DUF88 family protein
MEKSLVLIDGQNVIKGCMTYCELNRIKKKVDYVKLINTLSENTNLLRAYFYDAIQEKVNRNKEQFLYALQKKGIQLRTKTLKNRSIVCNKCGNKEIKTIQKGVDVSLATDILRHAWQNTCDICIIVSGDEDYKDAIECVKDKGVKI